MKKKLLLKKLLLTSTICATTGCTLIATSACGKVKHKNDFNSNLKSVGKSLHKFYTKNYSPSSGKSKSYETLVGDPNGYPIFADYVCKLLINQKSGTLSEFKELLTKYFENSQNSYAIALSNWKNNDYQQIVNIVSRSVIYYVGSILIAYVSYRWSKQETIDDTKSNTGLQNASSPWGSYMKYFADNNIMDSDFITYQNSLINYSFQHKDGVYRQKYFLTDWTLNLSNKLANPTIFNVKPISSDSTIPNAGNLNSPFNGLYFEPSSDYIYNFTFDTHYDITNKLVNLEHFKYNLEPAGFTANTNKFQLSKEKLTDINTIYVEYKKYLASSGNPTDLLAFYNGLTVNQKNLYLKSFLNVTSPAELASKLTGISIPNWTSSQQTAAKNQLAALLTKLAIIKFSFLMIYVNQTNLATLSSTQPDKILANLITSLTTDKTIAPKNAAGVPSAFATTLNDASQNILSNPRFNLYGRNENLFYFFTKPWDLTNINLATTDQYPTAQKPSLSTFTFANFNLAFQFGISTNLVANNISALTFI